MSHPGDNIVLYLLLSGILFLFIRRWISIGAIKDWSKQQTIKKEPYVARGDIPDLLRGAGFDVISGKEKIELSIFVDEEEHESRLYIDYIAQKEDATYVVIIAKERKPIRMSGPALRDAFFSPYLLFRPDGILYVNREKRTMKVIEFELPDMHYQEDKDWTTSLYALAFGLALGVLITWLMLR